jgi:hypothetical protein
MQRNRDVHIRAISLSLALTACCASGAVAGETTSFTYDALGRLISADVTAGPRTGSQTSFQYDPAGNRTRIQTVGPTPTNPTTVTPVSASVNVMGASGGMLSVSTGTTSAGGTIAFSVNGTFVEVVDVLSGVAHVNLHGFAPGTYTVTADYSGDSSHGAKTATFTITIRDLSWLPSVLELLMSN